uniref:Uncharacterized protein n=1 Tax=Nelumbo nucifera TaxID=4432 RepID=A0A822XMH5_NELNU|nr:TPA_asm: hypothetical protein HUJ06_022366 [Nelumbo nucifera]
MGRKRATTKHQTCFIKFKILFYIVIVFEGEQEMEAERFFVVLKHFRRSSDGQGSFQKTCGFIQETRQCKELELPIN